MKKIFKKIIPYFLVLVILSGISFFTFSNKAEAQEAQKGTCITEKNPGKIRTNWVNKTLEECKETARLNGLTYIDWIPQGGTVPEPTKGRCFKDDGTITITTQNECTGKWVREDQQTEETTGTKTPFEKEIDKNYECGVFEGSLYPGCFVQLFYGLFYTIPSALLWLSAYFFNFLISITLNGDLFTKSDFLNTAWGVVRDISNIFFIIVLLYIAAKMILGIDSHGVKKTIANVIIMALLINFSMFFTKVIIDTSNVLALVFYNKMTVTTNEANGKPRAYTDVSGEKDISGGIVGSFNPTRLLTDDFFKTAGTIIVPGSPAKEGGQISPGMLIMVLLITGAIMLYAAYAFLIAGLSFLGRLIELFILIVFSPFAFMSFAVPFLKGTDRIGWDKWLSALIKTSFMAPIFMFFMYFIFLITQTKDVFGSMINGTGTIQKILLLIIPALFILRLLTIATEYAKKGSGAIGDTIMKYSKAIAGVGLGVATGGASLGLTSTLGAISNKVAGSQGLKDAANDKERGFTGWAARKMLKTADYGSKSSFDIRATGLGKKFASGTGINLGSASKGGYQGRKEKEKEKLEEESKLYKTNMSSDEVKAWSKKKQDEYDSNLAIAKKNGISEEEFKKKNGERPKGYKSADELNHAKMKEFINNFGQSGLTASLARTLLKANGRMVDKDNYKDSKEYKNWEKEKEEARKTAQTKEGAGFDNDRFERMFKEEHKEPTADSINKKRTQNVVMAAGVATALAGIGGVGWYAGAATAIKTAAGAAVFGAVEGISKKFKDVTGVKGAGEAAQGSFASDVEKEHKKLETIEKRIGESEKALKGLVDLLEKGKKMSVKDENTGEVANLVIKDENGNDVVNTDGIEKRLAQLAFQIKRDDLKLQELIKQGVPDSDKRIVDLSISGYKATIEQSQLNRLRTAPEQIRRLEKEKYDLGKDKDSLHEKGHGKKHKEEEDHPAPKHPKPAVHPEPEHGGGGGNDAGGGSHGGGGSKHP